MISRLLKLFSFAAILLVLALPCSAEEPVFRIRAGQFTPDGSSAFWNDKGLSFEGSAEDLEDVFYGLDWNYSLGRGMGILFGGSFFQGQSDFTALEDVDFTGDHTLDLEMISLSVLFTYMAPEEWRVRPWAGLGAGVHRWDLLQEGDLLDSEGEIFEGRLREDGIAVGVTAAIGVDFWIQKNWGLSLDFRQHWVDDNLSEGVEERGKLDLSGQEIAIGFVWMF